MSESMSETVTNAAPHMAATASAPKFKGKGKGKGKGKAKPKAETKAKPRTGSKQKGAVREPMPTKEVLTGKTLGQRVEMVLESWDTVTRLLRLLKGAEILEAVKAEKKRDGGARMNVLFRLAQRYDMVTKNKRIEQLLK